MKDVNDLMQAILEMDAAQRKASEKARAERAARLAALDASKQAIAAECDAKAQADADAAAKAADAANAEARAALDKECEQAAAAMAAQAEQHKAFQAAHVLIRLVPELLHVVVKANAGAGGVDVFGELIDGLRVKIDIGDGGEQALHQQQGLLRGRGAPLADQLCGVGDQRTGQPILCGSGLGRFTAYPGAPGAGGAVRGLLTLKAKHLFVHTVPPFPAEDTQSMDGPAVFYARP